MLAWVKRVGLENGIVVVINKSANLKGGKLPRCILGCERGGKYKPHHGGERLKTLLISEQVQRLKGKMGKRYD